MCWQVEQEIVGNRNAPRCARTFVDTALATRLPAPTPTPLVEDALLVVSELATNAVRAGASSLSVAVGVEDGDVRIEVGDRAEGWPMLRRHKDAAAGGRGLMLVDAVALDWGITRLNDGKSVWAVLGSSVRVGNGAARHTS